MNMLKRFAMIVTLVTMFAFPLTVSAASGDTIVHKTKTGDCYHTGDCYRLRSDITITLEEAVDEGLRPCLDCDPPTLDADSTAKSESTNANSIQKSTPNNTSSIPTSSSPVSTKTVHYVAMERTGHIYYIYQEEAIMLLSVILFILFWIFYRIHHLKKTVQEKDERIHDLETELEITQTKIGTMKEFQNQSNHTKEENV